jgi:hypothetical protein
MRFAGAIASVLMVLCVFIPRSSQANQEVTAPDKTIHAVRSQDDISIDGRLDESSWAYASPISDFTQREPLQDDPPTEKTEVRLVYDDEAIYFGIMMFDSEPQKIVKRLARRDRPWDADYVSVSIDPYHDHRSGFYFTVNAAGIEGDGLMYNDTRRDSDWDGVWDSSVTITDKGWSAEIKIPYHTIRFTEQDEYIWGLNVQRTIFRKNERDYWAMVRRGENGWVSRFGHIEGIEKISPPMRLQAIPYLLSSGQIAPVGPRTPEGNDFRRRIGANLKYGLTSNLTLDGTANPDFGQVEADEAVLNLSTFEAFFPEKRPFFIEGSQIFDTPMGLFYSRRIGRRPAGDFDTRDGQAVLLERPLATSILSAAKMTGRTQGGTTIGIVSAVTGEEFASLRDTVQNVRYLDQIEPRAAYNVLRLKRDVLNNSFLGLMATNAARTGESPATTAGADWGLNMFNNMYSFNGQVAMSRTGQDARKTGVGTEMRFSKRGGDHIGGDIRYEGLSPNFAINDLGFLRRSNIHNLNGGINLRGNNIWRFTRRRNFNFNTSTAWNFDGNKLRQNFNVNGFVQFMNWWRSFAGVGRNVAVVDDRETRENGLVKIPASNFLWWGLDSDFRRNISGGFNINIGNERDGYFRNIRFNSRFRIRDNIEIRISPSYSQSRGVSRWVANVDDLGSTGNELPVFGNLDTDRFNVVTRANITFTKDLSLQFYNQLFFASGDYSGFKVLTSPESFGTLASSLYLEKPDFENPDFNNRSMNVNAVFRWEYRPGSTLFLVWTQARIGSGTPGDAAFGRNLSGIFDASSENVLLMKFNYWWNI